MTTNNDLWILGISASPHNGAACLLRGSEIVVAIQEERLIRMKRAGVYGASPSAAVECCLHYAGIQPADLSLIVACVTTGAAVPEQDLSLNPILQTKIHHIPTLYMPHHYGHALSAFATSGFKESAILVIDGAGSPFEDLNEDEKAVCRGHKGGPEMISLYAASGTTVKAMEKHMIEGHEWVGKQKEVMPTYGSLGGMYSAVAYQIFGDLFEAGKVMGLAPYGRPEIPVGEFFRIDGGGFAFHDRVPKRFQHNDRWPHRQKEYSDLASSTQVALEHAVLYLADHLHTLFPCENLCYAGGVALNSVANERIIRESAFKNVYIMPAAEDSGTAIGAAYYGLWQFTKTNSAKRLIHDSVGPIYSAQQIESAITDTPAVEVVNSEDVVAETVNLLCAGKVVGWFEGKSELGPRALGQRSILCDARRSDAKEVLNSQVKHRESFRPFAPVVLLEHVEDWFDMDGACRESPFMLRICRFKEDKRVLVPGVVHIDETGRLQTISSEANGRLYKLVRRFYEQTGVPIILNTSYNLAGEPIVETPQDALNTLLSSGMDYCVLDKTIVAKRKEILFECNEIPWPQRLERQINEALKAAAAMQPTGKAHPAAPPDGGRPLASYVGAFKHDAQGRLAVEKEGQHLKVTLSGVWSSRLYGNMSAQLKRQHQDVFEVIGGRFDGFQFIFLPDLAGRVNVFAMHGKSNAIYFRQPLAAGLHATFYEQFVGDYKKSGTAMSVRLRNNRLQVSAPGQLGFELVHVKGTEFTLKKLPGYSVEFKTGGPGLIAAAIVALPNDVVVLEKCNE